MPAETPETLLNPAAAMLQRIKSNFDAGVEKLKWLSSVINERVKIELAVIKLLGRMNELEKKRDALMQAIGQRVFELKGKQSINPHKDPGMKDELDELEKLDAEIKAVKAKVSELGKIED